MRWGKLPHNDPDVCYVCGDGCSRADTRLLHNALAMKTPDLFAQPLFSKMFPSLLAELEARGYDLTTLHFSVRKRVESQSNGQS